VPDASDPGKDGILRRLVAGFGTGADDILVAVEMSIQRGYNILNSHDTAALGAVVYLTGRTRRRSTLPSRCRWCASWPCSTCSTRPWHPPGRPATSRTGCAANPNPLEIYLVFLQPADDPAAYAILTSRLRRTYLHTEQATRFPAPLHLCALADEYL